MTTREEHLEFCRRCLNRKFDPDNGVICSLTNQMASFEKECPDFKPDDSVVITVDDKEALNYSQIKAKLPPEIYERIRLEQDLIKAIIFGLGAAVIGAVLWGAFTVTFTAQFSGMPLLIGAGVGYAMRKSGKGVDLIFGFFGAGIALFGCLLGNFLSVIGFLAQAINKGYVETLTLFNYDLIPDVMIETFSFRHLVYYFLAIITGFGLAKRTITDKDVKDFKYIERQKRG
jgi:hypothetical protein